MKLFLFISMLLVTGCTNSMENIRTIERRMAVDLIMSIMQRALLADYIGEEVSQLEHALQAAHFAQESGADAATVVAALLHDIGHQLGGKEIAGLGKLNHAARGAAFLRKCGFNTKTVELVAGHVQAKRYLVAKDPVYYKKLSAASIKTLQLQGGPMTVQEAKKFENDALFREKLELRTFDEKAKIQGLEVEPLVRYKQMLYECIN